jgi:hypothetical protein
MEKVKLSLFRIGKNGGYFLEGSNFNGDDLIGTQVIRQYFECPQNFSKK